MHESGIMHKTFREFNGKTFMLDEFSYFGISKAEAEKRKAMWKKSGLRAYPKSIWIAIKGNM
jgi:hypothetical protein